MASSSSFLTPAGRAQALLLRSLFLLVSLLALSQVHAQPKEKVAKRSNFIHKRRTPLNNRFRMAMVHSLITADSYEEEESYYHNKKRSAQQDRMHTKTKLKKSKGSSYSEEYTSKDNTPTPTLSPVYHPDRNASIPTLAPLTNETEPEPTPSHTPLSPVLHTYYPVEEEEEEEGDEPSPSRKGMQMHSKGHMSAMQMEKSMKQGPQTMKSSKKGMKHMMMRSSKDAYRTATTEETDSPTQILHDNVTLVPSGNASLSPTPNVTIPSANDTNATVPNIPTVTPINVTFSPNIPTLPPPNATTPVPVVPNGTTTPTFPPRFAPVLPNETTTQVAANETTTP